MSRAATRAHLRWSDPSRVAGVREDLEEHRRQIEAAERAAEDQPVQLDLFSEPVRKIR